jgi:uncharacterized metal-binding protein YceD (DUF177 family)
MRQSTNEFSRPLPVDRVAQNGSFERLNADAKELAAVASRLGLPAIHALSALLKAQPWRGGLMVKGTVDAEIEQVSVVTLDQFRSVLRFDVERYFMPANSSIPEGEEDVDPIEHGEIDLGEIVVEQLALELDPYPRRPGEAFAAAEPETDPPATSPFAALSKLKGSEN